MAPTAALGKLFLDSASSDQRMFAFWVPFLLLHLGRPDNITAYSLEDNLVSWRIILGVILDLFGAFYGAYKQRFMGGDRVLRAAFVIMFSLGCYKYLERAVAMRQGTFSFIRSSNEKNKLGLFSTDQHGRKKLEYEDALFDAHRLLGITMGAFAYYPVKRDPKDKAYYYYWEDVCKVVEMELSLMYDIMYTKATVVHTWGGYLIRIASPPLTATALVLFLLHSKEGQRGGDIVITYILLVGTLLLDVIWLLRALGSTWTYVFLSKTWLKQAVCCRRGRWYRLRRFIMSLNCSRLENKEPSSYRIWSGVTSNHNMFHKCTHGTSSLWRTLVTKITLEDNSKGLRPDEAQRTSLLEAISQVLVPGWIPNPAPGFMDEYHGKRTVFEGAMRFGTDFHQIVLTWHIATDIFLLCTPESESSKDYQIIKVLSDYMMFFLAERPDMLPNHKIQTQYERTGDDLNEIWLPDGSESSDDRAREKKLANTLLKEFLDHPNIFLSDGAKYANLLQNMNSKKEVRVICRDINMGGNAQKKLALLVPEIWVHIREGYSAHLPLKDVLIEIRESWLRLLIYASIHWSRRDSHANQLSLGGELIVKAQQMLLI
jgi:hypothetical protein